MATKVTNLKVDIQNGTTNTLFASWDFAESTTSSSTLKKGAIVSIKSGAKYYNGVDVPDYIESRKWNVVEVKGDRVVLGKSTDGKYTINSAINSKYLTVGSTETSVQKNTLDHFKIVWKYATGDGVWFEGSSSNVTAKNATYSIPANATKVKVSVKPVSKTYKKNDKETSYWTGEYVSVTYLTSSSPPEKASTPSVEINKKYKLIATLNDIADSRADLIQFYVVKGNSKFTSGEVSVKTCRAVFSCDVDAGGKYRVRCRAINNVGKDKVYGEWSAYSGEISTIPSSVTNVTSKALSESSIQVKWDKATAATSYEVAYTTNESYFNSNETDVSKVTSNTTHAEITGLATGDAYFIRVRAVNDQGESGWSEIIRQIIGSKPAAPTTWSSTTTAIIGEDVNLHWTHNSEDGSKCTKAEIEISVNGTVHVASGSYDPDDDKEEEVYSYPLSIIADAGLVYEVNGRILWRVRTKGIHADWSDWSVQRTIDIYDPPTLELHVGNDDDTLTQFPCSIVASAGPTTQKPITFHISIIAENDYESENHLGSPILVSAGTEVYSRAFHTAESVLLVDISAGDVILENNQSYKVIATVSMDSGLTAESSSSFTVDWNEYDHEPNASISIDTDALCAYILPFCEDENSAFPSDVTLSVYRREYDGGFTEIATELQNDGNITVTDPHPSLDYARYRIVARNESTGTVSYTDLPGIPVDEPSIVIQWDEEWTNFDYVEAAEAESPPWNGSMVKLPYNVDTNESTNKDVALIEYIGREAPVSYYGTQKGESGSWSAVIEKTDVETLHALRRLSAWNGDVYVREPSGVGYWANISVSISNIHAELTIPVSFTITKVEGGI